MLTLNLDGIAKLIERETECETKLEATFESMNISGGVLVMTSDGTVTFDNTFEGRMRRMRKDLIKEIALILFQR
jgi:vacuolar-type H+-ATPase subunit E/Vma4